MKCFLFFVLSLELLALDDSHLQKDILLQRVCEIEKKQENLKKNMFLQEQRLSLMDGFDAKIEFLQDVVGFYNLSSKEQAKAFFFFESLIKNLIALKISSVVLSSGEVPCNHSFLTESRKASYNALAALSSAADILPKGGVVLQALVSLGLRYIEKGQEADNHNFFFSQSSFLSSEAFAASSALHICCFSNLYYVVTLSEKKILKITKKLSLLWRECVLALSSESFDLMLETQNMEQEKFLDMLIQGLKAQNISFLGKISSLFYERSLKQHRRFFKKRSDFLYIIKADYPRKIHKAMLSFKGQKNP